MINRDGNIKRLTYLTTNRIAEEQSYTWSPDQKKIAFWLKTEYADPQWDLAVLNIETGEITDYCLGGGDGSFDIFWSPSGDQLITTYIMPNNALTNETRILLINMQNNSAKLLLSKQIVLGWMTNNN